MGTSYVSEVLCHVHVVVVVLVVVVVVVVGPPGVLGP